jgi:pimeloyl-ACP methyl ester carboxylesterase
MTLSETIRFEERGSGRPVVFVHGLLVSATLWRNVLPNLPETVRAIAPTWPLGAHEEPMPPDADLTPLGLARLVADFLASHDLDDVVLVGNDTGGAIVQIAAAHHPERIGAVVLTSCDTYDNFLPPLFRPLQWLAHVPGSSFLLLRSLQVPQLRRLPIALGWLTKRPIPDEVVDAWAAPGLRSAGVRRDLQKVLRGIHPAFLHSSMERLRSFDKPVTLAWAREDKVFKPEYAERLANDIPGARIEWIDDAYSFVPEDQPAAVARIVASAAAAR